MLADNKKYLTLAIGSNLHPSPEAIFFIFTTGLLKFMAAFQVRRKIVTVKEILT